MKTDLLGASQSLCGWSRNRVAGAACTPKPLQLPWSPVCREESAHRGESQAQDSNPALLILNPVLLCPALRGPCINNRGTKKGLGEGPVTLRHVVIPTAVSHLIWLLNLLGVFKNKMKVLVCVQDSQQLMQGHVLLPAEEQRGQTEETLPAPPRGGQGHGRGMGRATPGAPTQDPRNRRCLEKPSPPSPECLRYRCYLILTHTW